jgi:hypothetical protein
MLERIREQPQHVREMMFGFSVVISIALVGAVWFNGFQKDLYALLNEEEVAQERFFAQDSVEKNSIFSVLGKTLGDMGSVVSGLWGSNAPAGGAQTGVENRQDDRVYLLPLSEGR